MLNKIKSRTPLLALILFVFAVGYTVAAKVVVVPLGGDSMPSGMVSAFNDNECPAGWAKYTTAQGRFVVGLRDGGQLGYERGQALSDAEVQTHNHQWAYWWPSTTNWRSYDVSGVTITMMDWGDGMDGTGTGHYPLSIDTPAEIRRFYTNTRVHTPPYVQLLYCEKV